MRRERVARVARELVLGGLLLEIEIVVVGLAGLAQRVERRQRGRAADAARSSRRRRERDPAASAPQCQATGAPQSCPTISARFSPSAVDERDHVADVVQDRVGGDIVAARWFGRSRACRARPRGSRPRRAPSAGAATNTRAPASRGTSAPAGPSPHSATCISIPFAGIVRCRMSAVIETSAHPLEGAAWQHQKLRLCRQAYVSKRRQRALRRARRPSPC